ncbi:lipoprotein [Spiroplasma endosymbiont of Dioctria linearis]|uniref:lipoprotein n=1 Tax=Spiroplasma endosymbiont of Dioctria linearis TaxID=3066290 RepID=UPI00313AD59A
MKKLLTILAGLGIASSATTSVIACGNKKQPPIEENNDVSELIEQFKKQSSEIMDSFINSKKNKLLGLIDDNGVYNFFNRKNIEKYGTNTSPEGLNVREDLTENLKDDIVTDFNNILRTVELRNKLNELANSSDKFNVIIWNNEVVDSLDFDKNSIDIKYTNKDWQENEESNPNYFLSSTVINLKITIQFKNNDGNKQSFDTTIPLVFTYTNDEVLLKNIDKIQKNIENDFLSSESKFSWLDYQNSLLNLDKRTSYKIFDFFNSKKRASIIENIYASTDFRDEFINFIKNKYLSEINIGLEFSSNNKPTISKNSISSKVEANNYNAFLNEKDGQNYKDANQSILINIEENGNEVNFKDYGTKNVNKDAFSLLNKNLKTMYQNYETLFKTFLAESNYNGVNKNTNSLANGKVTLEGLSLVINSNYKLPINSVAIKYSLAIDNAENKDLNGENLIKDTSFGNAIYFNTIEGIKSFQNVFDTRESTILNGSSQFQTPFAFSGKVRDEEIEGNIWDNLQKVSDGSYVASVNKGLSLLNDNQIDFRDKLLENGHQGIFNLYFTNYYSNGSVTDTNWFGIYSDVEKTENGYKQIRRYKGYQERKTGILLKFNFLNIVFVFEEYGKPLADDSIIIERSKI